MQLWTAVVAAVLFALPAAACADVVYLMMPPVAERDAPLNRWVAIGKAFDSARECFRDHEARLAEAEKVAAQARGGADRALLDRADALQSASPDARRATLHGDAELRRLLPMLSWPAEVRSWRCIPSNDPRLR